jgi:hypothetical protein
VVIVTQAIFESRFISQDQGACAPHASKGAVYGPSPRSSNGDRERQGGLVIGHHFRVFDPAIGQKVGGTLNPESKRTPGLAPNWSERLEMNRQTAGQDAEGWLVRQASSNRDTDSSAAQATVRHSTPHQASSGRALLLKLV